MCRVEEKMGVCQGDAQVLCIPLQETHKKSKHFLGTWEEIYNPDFNCGEFAIIESQAGLHSYKISVKEWVAKTNAIGLTAKAGRHSGTYAHKDIAFEFGIWISAEFKIYLIKEFQCLKDEAQKQLGWNIRRNLAKVNYRIHTDAIKENLIPATPNKQQISHVYASEVLIWDNYQAKFEEQLKEEEKRNELIKENLKAVKLA